MSIDEGTLESEGPEGRALGTGGDDVARYAADVRAELSDLTSAEISELLEDLEDHLGEVAAEDTGDLRTRLGTPADYARELRVSAGLPPYQASASAGVRSADIRSADIRSDRPAKRSPADRLRRRATWAKARATQGKTRAAGTAYGAATFKFLPTLRPAWWVVRGWLAVVLLQFLTNDGNERTHPIPRVGNNALVGFIFLLAAISVSVWFAQRPPLRGIPRRLLIAGHVSLAVVAFAAFTEAQGNNWDGYPSQAGGPVIYSNDVSANGGLMDNGRPVTNLFAYDQSGRLLDGVFVYDQDGNPIQVGVNGFSGDSRHETGPIPNGLLGQEWVDGQGSSINNVFPQRQVRFALFGQSGFEDSPVPWISVKVPQGAHPVPLPTTLPDGTVPTAVPTPWAPLAQPATSTPTAVTPSSPTSSPTAKG